MEFTKNNRTHLIFIGALSVPFFYTNKSDIYFLLGTAAFLFVYNLTVEKLLRGFSATNKSSQFIGIALGSAFLKMVLVAALAIVFLKRYPASRLVFIGLIAEYLLISIFFQMRWFTLTLQKKKKLENKNSTD